VTFRGKSIYAEFTCPGNDAIKFADNDFPRKKSLTRNLKLNIFPMKVFYRILAFYFEKKSNFLFYANKIIERLCILILQLFKCIPLNRKKLHMESCVYVIGLPDGIFSDQKSQLCKFWRVLQRKMLE
jgi:hypothetical protein